MKTVLRMTNSTELVKKHKSEYLKAGKLEASFSKFISKIKVNKPLVDARTGFVLWGTKRG